MKQRNGKWQLPSSLMSPEQKFLDEMHRAGIPFNGMPIADQKIHRFHIESDKPGTLNGWYVFSLHPNPFGAFGSWKEPDVKHRWFGNDKTKTKTYDPVVHERIKQEQKRLETEQERKHQQAVKEAKRIWETSAAESGLHRYLRDKRIKPHGIRSNGFELIIPLYRDGALTGLQFIKPDGSKKFLPGTKKKGSYCLLGKLKNVLYVCEGFATGATIHELTNDVVAVAFDAGNLESVARHLRERHPNIEFIIAADNDCGNESNVGVAEATVAALDDMSFKEIAGVIEKAL